MPYALCRSESEAKLRSIYLSCGSGGRAGVRPPRTFMRYPASLDTASRPYVHSRAIVTDVDRRQSRASDDTSAHLSEGWSIHLPRGFASITQLRPGCLRGCNTHIWLLWRATGQIVLQKLHIVHDGSRRWISTNRKNRLTKATGHCLTNVCQWLEVLDRASNAAAHRRSNNEVVH